MEFESWEAAMASLARREVSEFAAGMAALCEEPRFYDPDVIETWECQSEGPFLKAGGGRSSDSPLPGSRQQQSNAMGGKDEAGENAMGDQSVGVTVSREAAGSSPSATERRIIAVVGATGAQGGGLVRAILRDPDSGFVARAITRNSSSERGTALSDLDVEVVQADLDDRDSLVQALQGAYGAFCVTNYWELYDPQKEKAQARNLALAAQAADVQHVIWSTLEDTRKFVPLADDRMPTLLGNYKVPHFDGKGEADQFFTDAGVPTTFLLASFYWENMIYFGLGPKVGPDGLLTLGLPMGDAPLAGICADDIGPCAYGVFRSGADAVGQRIGIAGEHLTGDEMASRLTNALGREVRYDPVSPEIFRSFGFPGAEDIGNMFQFYTEFSAECLAARSVSSTRTLYPEVLNFERWLEQKGHLIPLD